MFDGANFELNCEQLVEVFEKKSTTELANQWLHYKQQEELAQQRRLMVEQELFSRLEHNERTGARTYEVGAYKVCIKRENSWSVQDAEQLEMLFSEQSTVPYTKRISISNAKMNQLAEQAPSLYKKACRFLTVKPAKPNFVVILKEKK